MKKLLVMIIILAACVACLSSCKFFACKHKNTVTDAAVAPTCTENGLTEGSHCAKCGEVVVKQEIVNALGHTDVIDDAVAPTCTESGLTTGVHCSVCNQTVIAQQVVPAAHTYGEWQIVTESDCFFEGEKTHSCKNCGYIENAPIETIEHSFVQNKENMLFYCEHCNGVIYAGHLYAVIDVRTHWFDAYELCNSLGGHLATITSAGEQAAITSLMSKGADTSENRQWVTEEGLWLGGIRNTDGWNWVTGENFEYTNWDRNEPENDRISAFIGINGYAEWHDCHYIHNGDTGLGFICEWDLEITESSHFFSEWEVITEATCFNEGEEYRICTHCGIEETKVTSKIEHNFVLNAESGLNTCEHCSAVIENGRMYKVFDVNVSWFDAYTRCESLGGHLVTITSAEEQAFIENYMSSISFTNYAWIGAYTDSVNWKWVTGEEFEYTNWNAGEPNCTDGVEFFAHLNHSNNIGKWNDFSPIVNQLAFICEWEIN